MWEQLKSGKLHTILPLLAFLKQLCKISSQVGWHIRIGADKGVEVSAYDGFKGRDGEECEDVEEDQAQEAGSAAGQEQGWGCQ